MPLRISGGEDGESRAKELKMEGGAGVNDGPDATATATVSSPTAAVSEAGVVTVAPARLARLVQRQQQQQGHQEQTMPEKTISTRYASAAVDKRSREYVLKSGLAGGLAGCAVCDSTVCLWHI